MLSASVSLQLYRVEKLHNDNSYYHVKYEQRLSEYEEYTNS